MEDADDLDVGEEIPTIKRMLVILEPTALATTISVAPSRAAATEEANSGNEVPKPTINTPIANELIPKLAPICLAPNTNMSAPLTKAKIATTKTTNQILISIIRLFYYKTNKLGSKINNNPKVAIKIPPIKSDNWAYLAP